MNELRKLIVHIGPGKTGTTSIQDSLTRNEQHLLQQGVLYPSFLGPRGVCSANTLASATGKLANVAEESRAHTLVISSEFLWFAPPPWSRHCVGYWKFLKKM